jgi:purine-cytosine permease-like protein
MIPVKVKAYGLINFTKKQYIIVQSVVFGIIILVFLLSFFYDFDKFMFGYAKSIILVIAFLELIETFFMFKKFREKKNK